MTDYKNLKLIASSSPHIRSSESTRTIMMDVIIAMIPALAMSVFVFGFRALALTLVSVAACVFWEWGYRKLLKKPQSIGDLSAVVTGMLLAFVCPPTLPYWMIIIGAFFAIVVVKQLYGGIGCNFLNPALVGGSLGEVSALMLLLGGVYLVIRKVISWHIPVAYIATVAILTLIAAPAGISGVDYMLYNVFGGGLMLGAIFMATDYATSPVTKPGQIIFGIGCGLLTCFIRRFGSYPEGVCYSILIMNCTTWLLDKYIRPTIYGAPKKEKKEAAAK